MMDLLSSPSSSSTSSISSRGLLMVPYMKSWNATALPYHFLLIIFIEALVHMGWCDYNPGLGFKIPESHSGEFPGSLTHLASPSIYLHAV